MDAQTFTEYTGGLLIRPISSKAKAILLETAERPYFHLAGMINLDNILHTLT